MIPSPDRMTLKATVHCNVMQNKAGQSNATKSKEKIRSAKKSTTSLRGVR